MDLLCARGCSAEAGTLYCKVVGEVEGKIAWIGTSSEQGWGGADSKVCAPGT